MKYKNGMLYAYASENPAQLKAITQTTFGNHLYDRSEIVYAKLF